jgi:hypothetical protein
LPLQDEKEDPSMEEEGAEWNEMRAVLNTDNMVSGRASGRGSTGQHAGGTLA